MLDAPHMPSCYATGGIFYRYVMLRNILRIKTGYQREKNLSNSIYVFLFVQCTFLLLFVGIIIPSRLHFKSSCCNQSLLHFFYYIIPFLEKRFDCVFIFTHSR